MRKLLRKIKNLLIKINCGRGIRDKIVFSLICLRMEFPTSRRTCDHFLLYFSAEGFISVAGLHQWTAKTFKLAIRSSNSADYQILWEFLCGGLYFEIPKKIDRICDCGANIGVFCIHAGLLFPTARIVCYEPEEANFQLLLKNLSLNGIEADCRRCGVWSSNITGYFHPNESFNGFISEEPSEYPIRCELPEVGDSTWLKMDAEGAEYEVMPVLIKNGNLPRTISIEVHDFFQRGRNLCNLLEKSGYSLRTVTDGSAEPESAIVYATAK
jgi:FkbM family methyltransferase